MTEVSPMPTEQSGNSLEFQENSINLTPSLNSSSTGKSHRTRRNSLITILSALTRIDYIRISYRFSCFSDAADSPSEKLSLPWLLFWVGVGKKGEGLRF